MSRKVVIGHHGHCFDGMCSAVALTRLIQAREGGNGLEISYRGLDHQPGGSFVPDAVLAGEINAVVDFRYTTSDRLTWWFDHHVSGIVGEEERAHFHADASGRKFFDPGYGSCCKLIADVALERFGVAMPELEEMVHWADIIDAARFPDAKMAVELEHPALQLMTVIEVHGNDSFLAPCMRDLLAGASLSTLAADARVKKLFAPLRESHEKTCETIRQKATCVGGVVSFDLVGSGNDRYNKFIPYWLYPESRYCVAVTAGKSRAKVSVGSNPWATVPRTHDIAAICSGYGGGGHPVVGAVSLKPDHLDRAREIAAEIVSTLSS